MIENGWMLLVVGFAGAIAFFAFVWMMTKGLRRNVGQRMDEQEEIRQAELRRARGSRGWMWVVAPE